MMIADEQLFQPVAPPRRSDHDRLAFRERSLLPPCARFGPARSDGFELFVTQEAETALRAGTRRRTPKEAFGWLMGRAFHDQRGSYAVVVGATYAAMGEAGPGHVRLSPDEMAALRRSAVRAYPEADEIGWTHSHRRPSGFSGEDRDEQTTWPTEHAVGIVTFMETRPGEPWATAYRGPNSEPLPLAADAAARITLVPAEPSLAPELVAESEGRAEPVDAEGIKESAPMPSDQPLLAVRRSHRPRTQPKLRARWSAWAGLLGAVAAILLSSLAFLAFTTRVPEAQVDRLQRTVIDLETRLAEAEGRQAATDARMAAIEGALGMAAASAPPVAEPIPAPTSTGTGPTLVAPTVPSDSAP